MPLAISQVANVVSSNVSYTTAFPATENPISQGGIWLNGLTDGLDWNDIQTAPGTAYAAAFDTAVGGVQDGIANLKRSFLACARKQFASGTCFRTGGYNPNVSHEIAVYLNMTITAHSVTGYECYISSSGAHTLVRWNGPFNNFTPLASDNVSAFTNPVDGDVIRIENDGAGNLSCFQNGILRTTATDTTWTGGNPGMGNNPPSGGNAVLNGIGWKSWTGGNL